MNSEPTPVRLLICFDGSDGAARALDEAARLFPGASATVTYAWRAPMPYGGTSYGGQIVLPPEVQHDLEAKVGEQAEELVANGVRRAQGAGLDATADAREALGPIWRELLDAAEDSGADVIVVGSHGYGELRALMLGSTSAGLAHHGHRPLLIVPAVHKE